MRDNEGWQSTMYAGYKTSVTNPSRRLYPELAWSVHTVKLLRHRTLCGKKICVNVPRKQNVRKVIFVFRN